MGSQSNIDLAYIAGFLDGDGSLMLQIKKRKDSKAGKRFMATVCFYQDSRHAESLSWIRSIFGIGYLSNRNDGMSELRINGFAQVKKIIQSLLPFLRFKKHQGNALYQATSILEQKSLTQLSRKELEKLVSLIEIIQNENYVARRKKTKVELQTMLGLTP